MLLSTFFRDFFQQYWIYCSLRIYFAFFFINIQILFKSTWGKWATSLIWAAIAKIKSDLWSFTKYLDNVVEKMLYQKILKNFSRYSYVKHWVPFVTWLFHIKGISSQETLKQKYINLHQTLRPWCGPKIVQVSQFKQIRIKMLALSKTMFEFWGII